MPRTTVTANYHLYTALLLLRQKSPEHCTAQRQTTRGGRSALGGGRSWLLHLPLCIGFPTINLFRRRLIREGMPGFTSCFFPRGRNLKFLSVRRGGAGVSKICALPANCLAAAFCAASSWLGFTPPHLCSK